MYYSWMMIKTMVSGVLTMTPMMMMISNFHDYNNNINQTIDIKDKKNVEIIMIVMMMMMMMVVAYESLALSPTTNVRLLQTQRFCRGQF